MPGGCNESVREGDFWAQIFDGKEAQSCQWVVRPPHEGIPIIALRQVW